MSVLSHAPQSPPIAGIFAKLRQIFAGRAREWPTVLLVVGCYGGFAALTVNWHGIPAWLAIPMAGYLICLHGHLSHEIVHGHPTNSHVLNRALVGINLGGWVPFPIYRDIHLAHHASRHLSHPVHDPESFYQTPANWAQWGPIGRALFVVMNTVVGRMLLGGPWSVISFLRAELARARSGDHRYLSCWSLLLLNNCVLVAWWLWICDVPVWAMLAAFYTGLILVVLRSFIEHRPGRHNEERCAIVEGEWPLALLFLNNCYHLVHHDRPGLAWYDIRKVYQQDKDAWRARTGGHWFKGYLDVFLRYGLTPKDSPQHPDA